MAAKPKPIELTEDEIEEFMEAILARHKLEKIYKRFRFTSQRAFQKYCDTHPEFVLEMDRTRLASCRYIEDDIASIAEDYEPKSGRVHLEALKSLLVYLNPSKYSTRIDLNVNQQVSVRVALDGANGRMMEFMKTVTPALNTGVG